LHKTVKPVPRLTAKDIDRFYRKVVCGLTPASCWLWTGGVGKNGYPEFRVGDRVIGGHRVGYSIWHGQVPEGLVLDHAGPDGFGCRSRLCVHPLHLQAVTQYENSRRQVHRGEVLREISEPEQRALLEIVG
jgi:hypothetical protein